ncbi:hypothetical protein KIL84_018238, partial [Mauremys mutica]
MKSAGMEAKLFEEEQVSPYFIYATCLGTSEESKNAKYETKVEECDCQLEFHNVLLESELSSSSMSQLVSYTETSLEPSRVTGHGAAEPEVKHLCGKLQYSSGHKPKDSLTHLPSHEAFSSPLLPRERSAEKSERVQEIRVITQKPSAITFSDFEFLSHSANSKLHTCEVTDTEASSSEEEEEGDDDDDVFTELPLYGAFYNGLYKRTILLGKRDKCEHTRSQYVCHLDGCNDHTGKKLNVHEKEEKQIDMVTQPEKGSEWSDSMSSLMKKLEQLNLDIEEALSAGSSPSSTPSTKKRKQPCPVKVETGLLHRDHQRKGICGNKRAGYQDLDGLPSSVSTGARPKTE